MDENELSRFWFWSFDFGWLETFPLLRALLPKERERRPYLAEGSGYCEWRNIFCHLKIALGHHSSSMHNPLGHLLTIKLNTARNQFAHFSERFQGGMPVNSQIANTVWEMPKCSLFNAVQLLVRLDSHKKHLPNGLYQGKTSKCKALLLCSLNSDYSDVSRGVWTTNLSHLFEKMEIFKQNWACRKVKGLSPADPETWTCQTLKKNTLTTLLIGPN